MEGLEDHHYAIKSSIASQFNWIMYFLSTNEIVIYFTIYENMMLSRRLKIRLNYFLTILTENKIKVTSSGTSPASIDKILKMVLTPPGGRDEGL